MSARTDFTHVNYHTELPGECIAGHRPQATGYWLLGLGRRLQATGHRPQASGYQLRSRGNMKWVYVCINHKIGCLASTPNQVVEGERRGCSYSYSSNFPPLSSSSSSSSYILPRPHTSGEVSAKIKSSAPTLLQLQDSRQHTGHSEDVESAIVQDSV
ncbi:hypothetical protein E2C01_023927 [Portunus trituberculatus]|uniref:Uncharacterized protein n=1 Tax=Portunus trituberculatus TaxID=210409 RepID=A0A5B7EBC7_PORTR|nr:hypothetical protein [Portunus trituberculatus]